MKALTAPVAEIFVSTQGEGLFCGGRQVFLRFSGCNLRCSYCDEPASLETARAVDMTPRAAAAAVIGLAKSKKARMVSLTGGEPLLQWRFIKALAPALKKAGLALHLETNGTLAAELARVKKYLDVVAMDIKLPSSGGGRPQWKAHRAFLAEAPQKTFVKVVITADSKMAEIGRAVRLAAAAGRTIPFFIQPVTPRRGGPRRPAAKFVEAACCLAAEKLARVSVLPQQHPLWGVK